MSPEPMDTLFHALASPVRRRILDVVKDTPGCNLNHVCTYFDVSRIAVMKHLGILERANLIISEKKGRSRSLHFNAAPIQMIYDRWTTEFSALWAERMTRVKYRVENKEDRE